MATLGSGTGAQLPGFLAGPTPGRRPVVLDAGRTALIPLRPLSIGEILDGGFLVVRRNLRLMVGLPLVVVGGAAAFALTGVGLWFVLGNTTVDWAQTALVVGMALVGFLLLVQCLSWMTAILARVTLQTVLGEGFAPSTQRVTLRSSLSLFWPMLGLSLLQYLAAAVLQTAVSVLYYLVLGGVFLLGDEDSNLAVGGAVGVSVLTYAVLAIGYSLLALTVPALATESRHAPGWIGRPFQPTTVTSSFDRALRLIGLRNLVRVTLVSGGAFAISCAVVLLLAAGALVLVALFASSVSVDVTAVLRNPWTIGGVVGFALAISLSALLAYVAAVETLLYLDLRMRREGLDLALRFACVPVPQPTAGVAAPGPYPPAPDVHLSPSTWEWRG